jgi:hypothetical protein
MVYRKASGELNPNLNPAISPDRLAFEPKQAQTFNPFYDKVVQYVDESRGANPAMELFPAQWQKWDVLRQRIEPHEFMHPDWRNLPKMSFDEMQAARNAHAAAGYFTEGTPPQGAMPWGRLMYGRSTLANMGLLGAAAGGVQYLGSKLADRLRAKGATAQGTAAKLQQAEQQALGQGEDDAK